MAREPTSQITSSRAELRAKILRANFEPSHFRAKNFRASSEPSFSELFSSYTNEPSRTEPSLARSHPYLTSTYSTNDIIFWECLDLHHCIYVVVKVTTINPIVLSILDTLLYWRWHFIDKRFDVFALKDEKIE